MPVRFVTGTNLRCLLNLLCRAGENELPDSTTSCRSEGLGGRGVTLAGLPPASAFTAPAITPCRPWPSTLYYFVLIGRVRQGHLSGIGLLSGLEFYNTQSFYLLARGKNRLMLPYIAS